MAVQCLEICAFTVFFFLILFYFLTLQYCIGYGVGSIPGQETRIKASWHTHTHKRACETAF